MAGFTNYGKKTVLGQSFNSGVGASTDYTYKVHLVTSAAAPDADTDTLGELTQIASGNGYLTAGYSMTSGVSFFDTLTEDDAGDTGYVQAADITWTASGGPIPDSGDGARYAVLCDDVDDGDTGSTRNVIAFWDLAADRSVTDGQALTLQDCQLSLTE